jgi:hypothetical protein
MPIELSMAPPLLRATFSGTLSAADLAEAVGVVRESEAHGLLYTRRLNDLTGITVMEVRLPEIYALAKLRRETPLPRRVRAALVAATPVQVGVARMFQTLNDHPLVDTRLFAEVEAALAWLAEPEDPTSPTPTP